MFLDIGLEDLDKVLRKRETCGGDKGLDSFREVLERPIYENIMISMTALQT